LSHGLAATYHDDEALNIQVPDVTRALRGALPCCVMELAAATSLVTRGSAIAISIIR
jgi:hypothetical protein